MTEHFKLLKEFETRL